MRAKSFVLAVVAACAAMTAPVFAEDAASLTGTWNLTIKSPQGTRTPTMTLTQSGDQVSGTYKSQRGEVPISGKVTGNQFQLSVKISNPQGESITIDYMGTVQGSDLNGTVAMGQLGKTDFTGKKAP